MARPDRQHSRRVTRSHRPALAAAVVVAGLTQGVWLRSALGAWGSGGCSTGPSRITTGHSEPTAGSLQQQQSRAMRAKLSAQLSVARHEQDSAQRALDKLIADQRHAYDTAPEVLAARQEFVAARTDFSAAAAPILNAVHARAEYRAALQQKSAVQVQLVELQRTPHEAPQLASLARQALAFGAAASKLEYAALAADPLVQQAQDRLANAQSIAARTDAGFRVALLNDPTYRTARAQLDAARARVLTLEGQLATI